MPRADPVGQVMSVVVDCSDPEASAQFWEQVLGYTRIRTDDAGDGAGWVTIGPADRAGDRISFQWVEDYRPPTWPEGPRPQQLHLDVRVPDLEAGDEQVQALGARPLSDVVRHTDEAFRVYADPDGHPFCLVQPLTI